MKKLISKLNENIGCVVWSVIILIASLGIYNGWGIKDTLLTIFLVYLVYGAVAVAGVLGYETAKSVYSKYNLKGRFTLYIITSLIALIFVPVLLILWTSCFGVFSGAKVCS